MIENLNISHILDLAKLEDREALREAAKGNSKLLSLIDEYLDEYTNIFPESDWHKIYSGGMLSVPVGQKHSVGFDLLQMLQLTKSLRKLKGFIGYEKLVNGFKNPTQINSTYFEVMVASWCVDRAVSTSIEFVPEVIVKGKPKHPEFLWQTELGGIYCECKRGNLIESSFQKMISKLRSDLSEIYDQYKPWDTSLRLDVRFEKGTTNKIRSRFKSVVAQAANALKTETYAGKVFRENDVSAVLRRREDPVPQESEMIRASLAEVGPVSRSLEETTYLSLTMSLDNYRQKAAAKLLQDARTQLPPDSPSAVFIELGGYKAAHQKVLQLISGPAYVNVPWVSIWVHGEAAVAVWRNGQSFDDRLLLPKI